MPTSKKLARNMHYPIQEGPRVNLIADMVGVQFTDSETQISNLKLAIQIDTAETSDLDDIGQLFGLTRIVGETDNEFRTRIKAYWPGYSGSGTITDIKTTINRIVGIDISDITITEYEACKFLVDFYIGPAFSLVDVVKTVVWDIKAAGTYPFFNIQAGFEDIITGTDIITLSVSPAMYYDHFDYGDAEW